MTIAEIELPSIVTLDEFNAIKRAIPQVKIKSGKIKKDCSDYVPMHELEYYEDEVEKVNGSYFSKDTHEQVEYYRIYPHLPEVDNMCILEEINFLVDLEYFLMKVPNLPTTVKRAVVIVRR